MMMFSLNRIRKFSSGALLLALAPLAGCAFTNPENTPLVTAADRALGGDTKTSWAQVAAIPAALPLGLIDVILLHPVSVVDDSANDAWDFLWERPVKGSATRAFVFLPRVLATPVVFSASWIARSLLDIPPHGWIPPEPPAPPSDPRLDAIEAELEQIQQRSLELRQEREALLLELSEAPEPE